MQEFSSGHPGSGNPSAVGQPYPNGYPPNGYPPNGYPPNGYADPVITGEQPPAYVVVDDYETPFDYYLRQFRKLADGRSVLLAMVDNQFTRTLAFYGGLERFNSSSSDVFDGAHGIDNSYMIGVLQGRRHSTYLRSVFDFTYRSGDLPNSGSESGDIEVFSIMKNIYLDLNNPCEHCTTPYLGFGVGWAYVDGEGSSNGIPVEISSESTFAYQLLAGLSYKLDPKSHLFSEFRFFGTNDNVYNSAIGSEGAYYSNNLLFGIRFGY